MCSVLRCQILLPLLNMVRFLLGIKIHRYSFWRGFSWRVNTMCSPCWFGWRIRFHRLCGCVACLTVSTRAPSTCVRRRHFVEAYSLSERIEMVHCALLGRDLWKRNSYAWKKLTEASGTKLSNIKPKLFMFIASHIIVLSQVEETNQCKISHYIICSTC